MPSALVGAPASMSAWSHSTVTGRGPKADRIRAKSFSRKAWGLSGLGCRPWAMVSGIRCYASAQKYSENSIRWGEKSA